MEGRSVGGNQGYILDCTVPGLRQVLRRILNMVQVLSDNLPDREELISQHLARYSKVESLCNDACPPCGLAK